MAESSMAEQLREHKRYPEHHRFVRFINSKQIEVKQRQYNNRDIMPQRSSLCFRSNRPGFETRAVKNKIRANYKILAINFSFERLSVKLFCYRKPLKEKMTWTEGMKYHDFQFRLGMYRRVAMQLCREWVRLESYTLLKLFQLIFTFRTTAIIKIMEICLLQF